MLLIRLEKNGAALRRLFVCIAEARCRMVEAQRRMVEARTILQARQGRSMLYGGGSFLYWGGSWRPGLLSVVQVYTSILDRARNGTKLQVQWMDNKASATLKGLLAKQ